MTESYESFDNLGGNSWGPTFDGWPYLSPPKEVPASPAEAALQESIGDPEKPADPVLTQIVEEAQGEQTAV